MNKTGQLVIYSDSNERYSYKERENGYVLSVSPLNLTVQSSDNIRNRLPFFQFRKLSDNEIDEECNDISKYHLPYYCYLNQYDFDDDYVYDCHMITDHYLDCNCSDHRKGTLCGRCKDGYSVAINSLYLSCVHCDGTRIALGWMALMALEFFPVTVMVIVIAIVNVNLNQGSLNAFILFCQMSAVSFSLISSELFIGYYDEYPKQHINYKLLNLFFHPLSIWNLDFINFLGENYLSKGYYSICISHSTTPLGAISFWYLIALYPLFLLMVFYVFIVLYEKGYRCVVFFIRPVHRVLARFWQMFKIQPSLTHTVASVYTLCFTMLTTVSTKILFPTQHKGKNFFL